MQLTREKVAVVTGAASGMGLAMAERFARSGLNVVMADIEEPRLEEVAAKVSARGVEVLAVPTDVSDEASVQALASRAVERFGAVHVLCNNAGVAPKADAWFGPLSAWEWVFGVNLWGVIHGVRAFLPHMVSQAEGHIVNTASILGLYPLGSPIYDSTKHAVVALTEDLYRAVKWAGLPVGVSVLCPGWVRTGIVDAERNWPARLGERPPESAEAAVFWSPVSRAVAEGATPAAVADMVADAVEAGRFWVFTGREWVDVVEQRWNGIVEGRDPDVEMDVPGLPPTKELIAELQRLLTSQT